MAVRFVKVLSGKLPNRKIFGANNFNPLDGSDLKIRSRAMSGLGSRCLACAVAVLFGMTIQAQGASLLVDGSGQLVGAKGVDVGGTMFDVEFVDGSCVSIFDGCDDPSDFDFTNQADGLLAAQAILDQVLLDAPEGMFDSKPELTFGCSSTFRCEVLIPRSPLSPPNTPALGETATNGISDFVSTKFILPLAVTTTISTNVYARFTIDPVIKVSIDIFPGSDNNNINLSSAGVIPVAILSSESFDATTVVEETIFLSGAIVKLAGQSGNLLCQERDVNNDGYVDLVCEVETADFMIETGDDTAELTAETSDETPIKGTDSIRVVPD